jgi:dTDP-4-amino-4,6-dideoxygalactose transaminase
MHCQGAFEGTDSAIADCEVTSEICDTVLSLPLDPYKSDDDINKVVTELVKLV